MNRQGAKAAKGEGRLEVFSELGVLGVLAVRLSALVSPGMQTVEVWGKLVGLVTHLVFTRGSHTKLVAKRLS
jgi:hypothetical protein